MPVVVYSSDPGTYRRVWLPFALWGLGLIAFGVIVIVLPAVTAKVFVIAFGALSLFAGVTQLASAVFARRRLEGWTWFPVIAGVIALGIGAVSLAAPDLVARLFAFVIGLGAFAWGLSDVAIGWSGRAYFPTWKLHVLRGLLSAGAGVFLMVRPLAVLVTMAWLVGLWAMLIGVLTLVMGIRARSA